MKTIKKIMSVALCVSLVICMTLTSYATDTYSIFGDGTLSGDDDRVPVSSTTGTNKSIAKLFVKYDNESGTKWTFAGSGFLINDSTLVTAGHNLMNIMTTDESLKKATDVRILFGASGTNTNPSYTHERIIKVDYGVNTFVHTNFKDSIQLGNYNKGYDYAYIRLSTPVKTGSYFTLSSTLSAGNDISIIGYENHFLATSHTNYTLLKGIGKVIGLTTTTLTTRAEAMPGQSGSPILNSTGKVVGIYTYSSSDGNHVPETAKPNTGTRVTNTLINFING